MQAADLALGDHFAFAEGHALAQKGQPAGDRRVAAVGAGQRDLLADDRREIAVEREDERFDLAPLRIVGKGEHGCMQEVEDVVDAAVVQEAETAHLRPGRPGARKSRLHLRHAEHADLLVQIAQVGDFELLRLALEGGEAIGAELVQVPIELVATITHEGINGRVEVEVLSGALVGVGSGQRVIEIADRVGRVRLLEDEVRECRHLRVAERATAAEEAVERNVERLERERFVEGVGVAAKRAARAIAAPVHRAVVGHAA